MRRAIILAGALIGIALAVWYHRRVPGREPWAEALAEPGFADRLDSAIRRMDEAVLPPVDSWRLDQWRRSGRL